MRLIIRLRKKVAVNKGAVLGIDIYKIGSIRKCSIIWHGRGDAKHSQAVRESLGANEKGADPRHYTSFGMVFDASPNSSAFLANGDRLLSLVHSYPACK